MVITISASYGAGGASIGPRLAERLGVPFLDRAIPNEVATRLAVPLEDAERHDETPDSVFERFIRVLAPAGLAFGARPMFEHDIVDENAFREATERVIREQAESGGGIILGRAAAMILRDVPGALHVRLYGPAERRIERAMEHEELSREDAERKLRENDRAREGYVHHFYGADPNDFKHYHLAIDTTTIGIDCAVDMIARAATP